MDEIINRTAEYIKLLTGIAPVIEALDKKQLRLPLVVTAGFSFYVTRLFGERMVLIIMQEGEESTPARMQIQADHIRNALDVHVVAFVMDKAASYNVQRMIQRRINFIIPGKQLYLPDLLMDLGRDSNKSDYEVESNEIPASAQLLLLYHLQKERLDGKHGEDLAKILSVSPASITRALKWLCVRGLAKYEGGKYKVLIFLYERKELWDKVYPFLSSPVLRVVYTDEPIPGIICGQNALAEYGMLVEANHMITAIGKSQYRTVKSKTDPRYGENRIEVWKYAPEIMSEGGFVDKLSLYLSMRDDVDERTQKELRILLEEIKW